MIEQKRAPWAEGAIQEAFDNGEHYSTAAPSQLLMLRGNNHSQTTGFKRCTFAQLKAASSRPAKITDAADLKAAKEKAPICAPHDGDAKTKDSVLAHDRFTMLWADIDGGNHTLADIQQQLADLGICSYAVYATASSQPDDQRWRVLVEIDQPIDFEHWYTLQSYLMDKLNGDDCATRPTQILYLPFKWEQTAHYEHATGDGEPLDVSGQLALAAIKHREQLEQETQQQAATAPQAKPRPVSLAVGQISPVELYNAAYALPDLLKQYGFRKVGRRYLHPNSTSGVPGVILLDGRYYSHHSNDPLADGHTHDAFDLFVEFEHGGDFDAAVKAAANTLDAEGQKRRQREHMAAQASPKPTDFDDMGEPEQIAPEQDEQRNPGNVAAIMQGTKLGEYAIQVADSLQMPRDTTALTALGVVSAPVSMLYTVGFEHSGKRPASLYVVGEQPPSSGKSEVLARFTRPIQSAIGEMNKRAYEANKQAGDDDPITPIYRAFITDATPEALEGSILFGNRGHFCLASAEQALVNTALGVTYGGVERRNNNDLILKGYGGEWHHSTRVSRAGFEGDVFGAVTVVAQPGTIDTILEQSNGTGIAERFLMLSEPTLLGYRNHTSTPKQPDQILEMAYSAAMNSLIEAYEKARECPGVEFDQLHTLHLARSDWDKLRQRKQELEPMMADGGRYSHNLLRGVVGKYDQRVMKLSTTLHVIEHLMNGQSVPDTISPRFVAMAMGLADLSLEQLYRAMSDKGLIGMTAEQEAIHRIVAQREVRGILWRELHNAVKGVQPFRSYPSKGRAEKIREVVDQMLANKTLNLAQVSQGGRDVHKFYAA